MKFANLILFSILVLAGGIRFWQIGELGYFMIDEERDAFLIRRLLVDHRPLLVGGVVPGGISLGPLFFYLSTIPYTISQLNPIGPAFAAGIIGVIAVIGTYVVGHALFGRRVGFLAMTFSAFSLLNIIYHRPWWPLTFGQLVTLVAYLALFHLVRKRSDPVRQGWTFQSAWWWVLVSTLIIGAQSDPSTLSLTPLSIIFLWLNRTTVWVSRKTILGGIAFFLIAHLSLLLFDFRHDFQNTKAVIQLLSNSHSSDFSISISNLNSVLAMAAGVIYRLFIPTGPLDVTKQISPCIEFLAMRRGGIWWPGAIAMGIAMALYVLRGIRSSRLGRKLLSLHVLIAFSGILFFTTLQPGYLYEWLWSFMFPALFLIMADMITALFKFSFLRISLLAVLAIWILSNLYLFSRLTNNAGLGGKLRAVQAATREIGNRPYELRSDGDPETGNDCFRYGGWRYLFTLQGNPPVKSYMDYVYAGWLYPPSSEFPKVIVTVTNLNDHPPTWTMQHNAEN